MKIRLASVGNTNLPLHVTAGQSVVNSVAYRQGTSKREGGRSWSSVSQDVIQNAALPSPSS